MASGFVSGKRVGPYRLMEELGAGGMGTVYLAERVDDEYKTQVAVKVLARGLKTPQAVARFREERQILAALEHPGIVRLLDGGTEDDLPYLVMERIQGVPITRHAAERALSIRARLEIFLGVCDALQYAHRKLVVHRDVKPSNILVGADGVAKLVDFGVAKLLDESRRTEVDREALTRTGAAPFTPAHASPEQVRGQAISTASDIYSLGTVLYQLLADAPAHRLPEGDTLAQLRVICEVDPDKPSTVAPAARRAELEGDLDTIILKALHKDPARRYSSVDQLADDLRRHLRGLPVLARPSTWGYRAGKFVRRNRAPVITAALLLAALAAAGGLALRARAQARRHTAALERQARLISETTQGLKDIEWLLRTAYLLPAHDVSAEEELVRRHMQEIADRAGGTALADYAAGRGHLALHEDDAALERLNLAASHGLDSADLSYARGLVLGRIYQRELAAARRSTDAKWVEERTAELHDRYLEPALAALQRSRGDSLDSISYLDGLIAFYRGDWAAAITSARAAKSEAPWLYQATQLEADATLARGIARPADERALTLTDLDEAGRLYDAALTVGRSDLNLYLGRAQVWIQRLTAGRFERDERLATAEKVEEWCRLARTIAPRSPAPWVKLAQARLVLARSLIDWGGDPMPSLEGAVDAARRALAIDEHDVNAHLAWGEARSEQTWWMQGLGHDPTELVADAIAHLQVAVELDPTNPLALADLGRAHGRRGRYLESVGQDTSVEYQQAIDEYTEVLRIDPRYVSAYAFEVATYFLWAGDMVGRGQSPAGFVDRLESAFAQCQRFHDSFCPVNASLFYQMYVGYELDSGRDATALLDRAEAVLGHEERGIWGHQVSANLHKLRLRAAVAAGADPRPAREAFAADLAACYALNPRDPVCASTEAEAVLLTARTPRERARAREVAARAVELDPRGSWETMAEAELGVGHIEAGLVASERGLATNPRHARILCLRGALLLARARASRSQADARAAREAFALAFTVNPLLARTYQAMADEAARLSGD